MHHFVSRAIYPAPGTGKHPGTPARKTPHVDEQEESSEAWPVQPCDPRESLGGPRISKKARDALPILLRSRIELQLSCSFRCERELRRRRGAFGGRKIHQDREGFGSGGGSGAT